MLKRQAECYREVIVPGLAEHGVFLRNWSELSPGQQEEAGRYFDSNLSPALTPLVIDPVHPFPVSLQPVDFTGVSAAGCAQRRIDVCPCKDSRCAQTVGQPDR